MKRIGIFGGSFDPVHADHVKICKDFANNFALDEVLIFPARVSPFKDGCAASGEDRANMLKLAFPCAPFVVRTDELTRSGKSYTCDTVRAVAEEFAAKGEACELYLLIGEDSALTFHTWKNANFLCSACEVVIAGRGGGNLQKTVAFFEENNKKKPRLLQADGGLSSTLIREELKLGVCEESATLKSVFEYIKSKKLYETSDELYGFVKSHSTQKRLIHTAGVIYLAREYAARLGENVEKAATAALLHDCAKYLDACDYKGAGFSAEGVPKQVVHQFLGAFVAEKVLGVTDEQVLSAIRWHTTGRPAMTTLEKIVLIADLLEPSRDFGEVEELREAVNEDFESGFKRCIDRLFVFLKSSGAPLYMADEVHEYYCGK